MIWTKIRFAAALTIVLSALGGVAAFGQPLAAADEPKRAAPEPKVEEPKRLEPAQAEKFVREYVFKDKPKINPEVRFPLKELTTDPMWKRLHVQVFEGGGFLERTPLLIESGKVFPLGRFRAAGLRLDSLDVADLNKSGKPALVYSYVRGSGICSSHVALCTIGGKEPKQYVADQTYYSAISEGLKLKVVNDQTVEVYVGDQKAGRLALEEKSGELKLKLVLDEKLPENLRKRFNNPNWERQR